MPHLTYFLIFFYSLLHSNVPTYICLCLPSVLSKKSSSVKGLMSLGLWHYPSTMGRPYKLDLHVKQVNHGILLYHFQAQAVALENEVQWILWSQCGAMQNYRKLLSCELLMGKGTQDQYWWSSVQPAYMCAAVWCLPWFELWWVCDRDYCWVWGKAHLDCSLNHKMFEWGQTPIWRNENSHLKTGKYSKNFIGTSPSHICHKLLVRSWFTGIDGKTGIESRDWSFTVVIGPLGMSTWFTSAGVRVVVLVMWLSNHTQARSRTNDIPCFDVSVVCWNDNPFGQYDMACWVIWGLPCVSWGKAMGRLP